MDEVKEVSDLERRQRERKLARLRQRRRFDKKNAVAKRAGWHSWSEYTTAVINGEVQIAPRQK